MGLGFKEPQGSEALIQTKKEAIMATKKKPAPKATKKTMKGAKKIGNTKLMSTYSIFGP